MAGCKGGVEGRGDLVVDDEAEDGGEPVEVGPGGGLLGLVKGKGSSSLGQVTKGSSCSTLLEAFEGFRQGSRVDGDGWW